MLDMIKRTPLTDEQKRDAERLKKVYQEQRAIAGEQGRKLNQEIIADACGWASQSFVSQLMNGATAINVDHANKLSRALNVPIESFSPSLAKAAESIKLEPNTSVHVAQEGKIPLISWFDAGCRSESSGLREVGDAEEWILFSDGTFGKNTYALKVQGESMFDPTGQHSFTDGDIIFVDPDKTPKNRSLVVVRQGGSEDAVFKQLIIEGNETMLKSLNPHWPNRIVPMASDTVLCGVVIAKYQNLEII